MVEKQRNRNNGGKYTGNGNTRNYEGEANTRRAIQGSNTIAKVDSMVVREIRSKRNRKLDRTVKDRRGNKKSPKEKPRGQRRRHRKMVLWSRG